MTREELEEIKARAEGEVYYLHAKRDVRRLLAEVERLQTAVADLEELLDKDGYPYA